MAAGPRAFTMIEFPARTLTIGGNEVELDSFALGDRCVSAADFHAFLADGAADLDHTMIDCLDPCFVVHRAQGFLLRPGCGGFPMIQISYWAAAAYCNWLSCGEGLRPVYDIPARESDPDQRDGYRLPTEAEWEAACRAGRSPDAAPDPEHPKNPEHPEHPEHPEDWNCADAGATAVKLRASQAGVGNFLPGHGAPVPVGSLPPDGSGLYEMIGNLREWCHDRYGAYPPGRQRNPRGAARGAFRVVRGGAFIDAADSLGPDKRMAAYEDTKCEVYGFRVARPL